MFKLAVKFLKETKIRTILTSTGVALSVAIIIALGTFEHTYISNYNIKKEDMETLISLFNCIMLLMTFVGGVIIYNTFTVIIYKRMKNISVLKTIGMSKKDCSRYWTCEAFITGIIGSIIGTLLGLILGKILVMLPIGERENIPRYAISIPIIILAITVGISMSVLTVKMLFRKVNKSYPMDTLFLMNRQEVYDNKTFSVKGFISPIIGISLIVMSIILKYDFYGINEKIVLKSKGHIFINLSDISFVILFTGILFLIPKIIELCLFIASKILGVVLGVETMLACRNLLRDKKRTASIVMLISMGLILAIGFDGMFSSFRASAVKFVNDNLKYDFLIEGKSISSSKINKIESLDEVSSLSKIYIKSFSRKNSHIKGTLYGIDPSNYEKLEKLDFARGNHDEVLDKLRKNINCVIISERNAIRKRLKLGDYYTINIDGKTKKVPIIGTVRTFDRNGNVVYVNRKMFDNTVANKILIKSKSKKNYNILKNKIKSILGNENYNIYTINQVREQFRATVVKASEIVYCVVLIILFIGVSGLVNTMILSIMEREKENAVLRSIGAEINDVRVIMMIESIILGIISISIGIVCGIVFIYAFSHVTALTLGVRVIISYSKYFIMLTTMILMISIILASMYPSYISCKKDIIQALKYE
ncbi:FtsX-like permease family protein (plasmid) [Haloimpatiens sp. FM7330]|uniref:ABC transporter permease n=1 Tax=Haloimpatiens sp. FM7330 TaxID=3298610 RepID=UPI003635E5CE